MSKSPLFIASDHRGFSLKTKVITLLQQQGRLVHDLGPSSEESCDAMDYAQHLAAELKANPEARGVLICMSGQAMAMTANRYQHIRAALCTNTTMARLSREHNDANVLVMGAYIIGAEVASDCLDIFLKTEFIGGRFTARRQRLTDLGGL